MSDVADLMMKMIPPHEDAEIIAGLRRFYPKPFTYLFPLGKTWGEVSHPVFLINWGPQISVVRRGYWVGQLPPNLPEAT